MTEPNQHSISQWVRRLKDGEEAAFQKLWDEFFEKLLRQAEARIRQCPPGKLDAEAIVASVFESLWRGARAGRFARLRDRDDLWWLLLKMTRRKAVNHIRHELAEKRGGEAVTVSLNNGHGNGEASYLKELISQEPSPEYLLILEEEYSRALAILRDQVLREIAVLRLEGYTIQEISEQVEISTATVNRKIRLINATWAEELNP